MSPLTHYLRSYLRILMLIMGTHAACRSGDNTLPETDPAQFIPMLDSVRIDGDTRDWPASLPYLRIYSDVCGNVPEASDLSVSFRLGWNPEGLFILAEVLDDSIFEDPVRFWKGDGLELFVSPRLGSTDIVQFSVRPSFDQPDSAARVKIYDHRRTGSLLPVLPASAFCSQEIPGGYRLEGRIPPDAIGIGNPFSGLEMALQLYFNDADITDDSLSFSLPWYPVRDSYRNPYAFFPVRFTVLARGSPTHEIRACVQDATQLRIKILSVIPPEEDKLQIICGDFHRKYKLNPTESGIYQKELVFPMRKFSSRSALRFMRNDSLFFCIDPCLLHRVYVDIPEPNRFEDEIRIFEIIDHFRPPKDNAILFTGSSTIRRWYDMEHFLPGTDLLNRGFGGSTMKDLNHYAERIVFPYNPSRIFVYEGDNDIAGGTDPVLFIEDCREFIKECALRVPDAEIVFLSIKPSLARIGSWPNMQEANKLLSNLADQYEKVYFIDISREMLDAEGMPRDDIFVEDRLHLNALGYEILSRAVRPFVYE